MSLIERRNVTYQGNGGDIGDQSQQVGNPGGHFTNAFAVIIQIWTKFHDKLFAHATTAQLTCYVQKISNQFLKIWIKANRGNDECIQNPHV